MTPSNHVIAINENWHIATRYLHKDRIGNKYCVEMSQLTRMATTLVWSCHFWEDFFLSLLSRFNMRGISAKLRRTAVWEADVCRHHRAPIKGPPETPRTSRQCGIEGFKGGPSIEKNSIKIEKKFKSGRGVVNSVKYWRG